MPDHSALPGSESPTRARHAERQRANLCDANTAALNAALAREDSWTPQRHGGKAGVPVRPLNPLERQIER